MSDEAISQESELQQNPGQSSDSCADAIAALAVVSILVVTVLFWLSNH